MHDTDGRFASTYAEARERFRSATRDVERGAIEVVEGLTIDWAWTGDPAAERILVFSSGVHGIEGFPGSAAQLEMLSLADGTATLWLHAVNPWGMANLRRVNEHNVDLNRNFLAPGAPRAGAADTYAMLDGLLNPPSPPGWEFVWPELAWNIARHGFDALKNAVVGGQYAFPRGLFYGGAELQTGARKLLDFLDETLEGRERIVHVDLHSGLGPFTARTLLLEGNASSDQIERVHACFGRSVKTWDASNPDAYTIRGGLTREVARRLGNVRYDALTCEFGTWSNLRLLLALRAENRLHHHGAPNPDHAAKRELLECFSPDHPAWRAAVVFHARGLLAPARALLAHD